MPNIIITGASDGIGAELARQLARRHGLQAMLVLAARNASRLQAVAAARKCLPSRGPPGNRNTGTAGIGFKSMLRERA
jgi:NAD(P)-dependent dehydrogenase (short-subunit alcohol dehydrogenase family)